MRLSGRGRACEWQAGRSTIDAEARRRRTIRLVDRSRRVNGWRLRSGRSDVTGRAECHIRRVLASEHALKKRRSFGEPARVSEARGFDHRVRIQHVIHVHSILWSETIKRSHAEPDLSRLGMSLGSSLRLSWRPVGESRLDRRTRVQRSQHDNRSDCGASKLRRDIRSDTGEAQHMHVQHLSSYTRRLEVLAVVVPQTQVQIFSHRGLLDHVGVAFELVTYCGSNEIGPVRVKALLYHQIDMTEIDVAEVDRDLLCVTGLCPQLVYIFRHPITIHMPSIWMVYGCK